MNCTSPLGTKVEPAFSRPSSGLARHASSLIRRGSVVALLATTLSAGASKADISGLCYFNNHGGPLPGTSCTGYSVQLGDKLFTVKAAPNLSAGKIAWETSPPLPANPNLWQVNIDWDGAGLPGPLSGLFEYTAEINQGDSIFESIGLSTGGNYTPGLPNSTVTASVYQGLTGAGPLIDSVTSIDGTANYSNLIGGTQIFVRDSWNIQTGDTIDNLSNYITQTNRNTSAPGPLTTRCNSCGSGLESSSQEADQGPKRRYHIGSEAWA